MTNEKLSDEKLEKIILEMQGIFGNQENDEIRKIAITLNDYQKPTYHNNPCRGYKESDTLKAAIRASKEINLTALFYEL